MKKLNRKLLNHRKAANNLACKSYRALEGKPYHSWHYTEDREISWCDVYFRKGKKVYNTTFLGLIAVIDDAVGEATYKHPEYATLPLLPVSIRNTLVYESLRSLERRIHEEGVVVQTGVEIRMDYQYGTGLIVSFPKYTFTEQDILDFISTWDGTNKDWGKFNSKDYLYNQDVQVNKVKI